MPLISPSGFLNASQRYVSRDNMKLIENNTNASSFFRHITVYTILWIRSSQLEKCVLILRKFFQNDCLLIHSIFNES